MESIKRLILMACAMTGIMRMHARYVSNRPVLPNSTAKNQTPKQESSTMNFARQATAPDRSYGLDRDNKPTNAYVSKENNYNYQLDRPYEPNRPYETRYAVVPKDRINPSQFERYDNTSKQMQQERQIKQQLAQPMTQQQKDDLPTQAGLPMRTRHISARY